METTDDRLPDLMRRATETLEPHYPDLVERGMRRGVVRRRRRRVLSVAATAAAVAMTVGGIAVVQANLGPQAGQPPVAGPSTPSPKPTPTPESDVSATPVPPPPASPAETLTTLKGLVPGLATSGGKTWGDNFIAAGLLVDDGQGKAWVEVSLQTVKYDPSCADQPPSQHCRALPDGTFLRTYSGADRGITYNAVVVEYSDRRAISLTSTNGLSLEGPSTRPEPALVMEQLVEMAYSVSWTFPPANYGKDLNR